MSAKKGRKTPRAGAVEGIRWFFSEDRPKGPPPKPYFLTYVGEGVAEVEDVGTFQNGTTAEVDADVAAEYRGKDGWVVKKRSGRKQ